MQLTIRMVFARNFQQRRECLLVLFHKRTNLICDLYVQDTISGFKAGRVCIGTHVLVDKDDGNVATFCKLCE